MELVGKQDNKSCSDNVIEYDFELKTIMQYKENGEFEKYIYFLKEHEKDNPEEVNILLADFFLFEKKTQIDFAEGVKAAENLMKIGSKEGLFFLGMSRLLGRGLPRDTGKGRKLINAFLDRLAADNVDNERNSEYEFLARLHLAKELLVWKKSKEKDLLEARKNYEYALERGADCYTEINEIDKKIYLVKKKRKKRIVKNIVAISVLILIISAIGYFVLYRQINLIELFADLYVKIFG